MSAFATDGLPVRLRGVAIPPDRDRRLVRNRLPFRGSSEPRLRSIPEVRAAVSAFDFEEDPLLPHLGHSRSCDGRQGLFELPQDPHAFVRQKRSVLPRVRDRQDPVSVRFEEVHRRLRVRGVPERGRVAREFREAFECGGRLLDSDEDPVDLRLQTDITSRSTWTRLKEGREGMD